MLSLADTLGTFTVQLPRADLQKYVCTGTDLVAGAIEITANRLARPAKMMREERLRDGNV